MQANKYNQTKYHDIKRRKTFSATKSLNSQATLSQRIRRWIPKYLSTYHTKSAICCLLYDSLQIDTTIFTTLLRLPLLYPSPTYLFIYLLISHKVPSHTFLQMRLSTTFPDK